MELFKKVTFSQNLGPQSKSKIKVHRIIDELNFSRYVYLWKDQRSRWAQVCWPWIVCGDTGGEDGKCDPNSWREDVSKERSGRAKCLGGSDSWVMWITKQEQIFRKILTALWRGTSQTERRTFKKSTWMRCNLHTFWKIHLFEIFRFHLQITVYSHVVIRNNTEKFYELFS